MTRMRRRQFLQFAGGAVASLGFSQLDIQKQSLRYAQVLAQDNARKLALLVGINTYPTAPLYGCVTDVELQRELLVHRFGFNPKNILTVTDAQATRKGILRAFEEHLIKQAKPGDVAVFHYSGHGSQVNDPDKDTRDGLNGTLVPVDSVSGQEQGRQVVNDIMGHTLFLLMSAVPTDNLTMVLDSCFSGGGKRGNMRVRSINRLARESGGVFPNREELAYQQQWLSRLKMSADEFKQKRRTGVAKGVVIASANRNQFASDATFDGFNAGAFTYHMTKYLWQQTGETPVVGAIANISRRTTQENDQDPELECTPQCDPNSVADQRPFYFLNASTAPAEAVITDVSGNQMTCWLGGIETSNPLDKNTILAVVDDQSQELAKVKLESRTGLIGKGTLLQGNAQAFKPGALLQEEVRGIPTNLMLRIGLDPSLETGMSEAKAALVSASRIEAAELGEGQVDYILGRITSKDRKRLQGRVPTVPEVGMLGLFTPTKENILSDSFSGATDESAADAVLRLQAKFKLLLANRILRAILNPSSSKLGVTATVVPIGAESRALAATRTRGSDLVTTAITPEVGEVKPGDNIQIQVKNQETQDLYISVLGIGSDGEMTVLFPSDYTAATDASLVGAGQTLKVPQAGRDDYDFVVSGPAGTIEVIVLASARSLRDTLKGLKKIASRSGQRPGEPLAISEPSAVVEGLLGDLTDTTRAFLKVQRQETQQIDATQLAALSLSLNVVE
ncbi:hypothetical protein C1752_02689 [Acaryochloris thomasi RCC1774]|uniref:Uncharacterized protein n=1 Tax=Acaryochloris thomasi RCC1774 TaxID=1764569 RepID=A0A2W1JHD8_9CYAN|nr:caspase family protein [Acaryochloris thomasi]PZD72928.1 hypothetical protein C1752_02689 [Acaryochloris thomasi RCC1774]